MNKDLSPPKDIGLLKCELCGVIFASSSALEAHRRIHPHMESDRSHRCPLCSYSTNFSTSLKKHLLTHSGEKPHQCTYCPKAFSQKVHLESHIRTHTGERPFSCSTCEMTFTQAGNLRRHERSHLGERPYICSTCGRDFSRLDNLKDHERLCIRSPTAARTTTSKTLIYLLSVVTKQTSTRDVKSTSSFFGKGVISTSEVKRCIEAENTQQMMLTTICLLVYLKLNYQNVCSFETTYV